MDEDLRDLDSFLEDEDEWDRVLRPIGSGGRDSGGRPPISEKPVAMITRRRDSPASESDALAELKKFVGPSRKAIAAVMVMIAITGVVAATMLFSQTLTPPITGTVVLTKGCDPANPTPPTVLAGTAGFVTWACGTNAAIFVQTNGGTVTPTITKGAEWTTTFIFKHGTALSTSCAGIAGARATASGTPITFAASDAGGWDMCSDFTSAINPMSQITYSWSQ